MRIRIVEVGDGSRVGRFACLACDGIIEAEREQVYADLDGPAFRAYYHGTCVPAMTEERGADGPRELQP